MFRRVTAIAAIVIIVSEAAVYGGATDDDRRDIVGACSLATPCSGGTCEDFNCCPATKTFVAQLVITVEDTNDPPMTTPIPACNGGTTTATVRILGSIDGGENIDFQYTTVLTGTTDPDTCSAQCFSFPGDVFLCTSGVAFYNPPHRFTELHLSDANFPVQDWLQWNKLPPELESAIQDDAFLGVAGTPIIISASEIDVDDQSSDATKPSVGRYCLTVQLVPDPEAPCPPEETPAPTVPSPAICVNTPPPPPATNTPTPTQSSTPTNTPPTGCPATPDPDCSAPAEAVLKVKDKDADGAGPKDALLFKYIKGPAQSQSDFGAPTSTASYHLCIYHGASSTLAIEANVSAGGTCAGDDCWKEIGSQGYKFRDKAAAQGGIAKILLRGDPASKTTVLLKGKDGALQLTPTTLPLDSSGAIKARVHNSDNANCWGADFPYPPIKHEENAFKDKIP